jgi:hypothetical protein
MKRLALILLLLPSMAFAQSPATYSIALSDQQIGELKQAIGLCESRAPLACSRLLLYLDSMLDSARQPKPQPPTTGAGEDKKHFGIPEKKIE